MSTTPDDGPEFNELVWEADMAWCAICDSVGHDATSCRVGDAPWEPEDDRPSYPDDGFGDGAPCAACGAWIPRRYVPVEPGELCVRCLYPVTVGAEGPPVVRDA